MLFAARKLGLYHVGLMGVFDEVGQWLPGVGRCGEGYCESRFGDTRKIHMDWATVAEWFKAADLRSAHSLSGTGSNPVGGKPFLIQRSSVLTHLCQHCHRFALFLPHE